MVRRLQVNARAARFNDKRVGSGEKQVRMTPIEPWQGQIEMGFMRHKTDVR